MDSRIAAATLPLLLTLAGVQHGFVVPTAAVVEPLPAAFAPAPVAPVQSRAGATSPADAPSRPAAVRDRNAIFRTDAQGRLIADADAIERLDALLEAAVRDHDAPVPDEAVVVDLAPPEAARALQLLQALRTLRAEEAKLFAQPGFAPGAEGALQRLDAQVALRRRHLGSDAQLWFGAQEERTRAQLQTLRSATQPGG